MVSPDDTRAAGQPLHRPGTLLALAAACWAAAFVVSGVAAASRLDGRSFDELNGTETFWTSVPLFAVLFAGAMIIGGLGPSHPADALGLRRWNPQLLATGVLVGVATQVAVVILYIPAEVLFDLDAGEAARDLTDRFQGNERWLIVLLTAVIAPVVEELFFRGLVQGQLARLVRPAVAIGITAVVFSLVHFQPKAFVGLAVFGAVAGWMRHRHDSTPAAMATHVGFNGISVAFLLS